MTSLFDHQMYMRRMQKSSIKISLGKNRDADTQKSVKKLRQSIYHLQITTNDNRKCGLIYSLFCCFNTFVFH